MKPMRKILVCLLALAGAESTWAAKSGTEIGDRVPRFQANGHDSHRPGKPTAYVFLGAACPTTASYMDRLVALEKEFKKKGVGFVYLYPNKTDKPEVKREHFTRRGLTGLFIDDQGAKIATLLGAARTSEVLVVDKQARIVYRGAIDDNKDESKVTRRHLATTLDEVLAGKKVSTPKTDVHA
jgi:hypothetical protein